MQITINIKDKDITNALENKVLWDITDEFSEEAHKAAGVTEASAVKVLREDAKFMAALEKQLARAMSDFVDDILLDCASDATSPALKKLATQLRKAEDAVEKKAAAAKKAAAEQLEQERVKQTIETLTKMGYKITKD